MAEGILEAAGEVEGAGEAAHGRDLADAVVATRQQDGGAVEAREAHRRHRGVAGRGGEEAAEVFAIDPGREREIPEGDRRVRRGVEAFVDVRLRPLDRRGQRIGRDRAGRDLAADEGGEELQDGQLALERVALARPGQQVPEERAQEIALRGQPDIGPGFRRGPVAGPGEQIEVEVGVAGPLGRVEAEEVGRPGAAEDDRTGRGGEGRAVAPVLHLAIDDPDELVIAQAARPEGCARRVGRHADRARQRHAQLVQHRR